MAPNTQASFPYDFQVWSLRRMRSILWLKMPWTSYMEDYLIGCTDLLLALASLKEQMPFGAWVKK